MKTGNNIFALMYYVDPSRREGKKLRNTQNTRNKQKTFFKYKNKKLFPNYKQILLFALFLIFFVRFFCFYYAKASEIIRSLFVFAAELSETFYLFI